MTGRWAVDSTPEYLYYRRCLPRIREVARDARFVVVLREPVARAYSAYNMYLQILGQPHFETRLAQNPRLEQFFGPLRDGGASPDIRTFLERELALIGADGPDVDEEPSLIRRGLYHRQIRRFVDAFGADRVLVLWSDELKRAPREVVGRVHAFLGIGPPDERDDFPEVHARAYDASTGADEGKARLRELAGSLFAADRAALVADGWTPPW
ncbi:MAG: sulfotransferase domain-containing protein [Alphaproteobacteria bacterium]|nr:sulfotransferase domain-containing protein [Alphaproteobacteria bacterium]MCB9695775.1 sulfotransferase domain-containing protein [Alphaproteobacteria bacterium]